MSQDPETGTPNPPAVEPEKVLALSPASSGRWLIETNSQHLFDLDERTYQRLPRPGRGSFAHDNAVVRLTRVERWPEVGKTFFVWFDDPERPESLEHWRQSSFVRSITRVVEAESSGAEPPA